MLNYLEFKNQYSKDLKVIDVENDDDWLVSYARYVDASLEHYSLIVRHCGGKEDNITVDVVSLEIGKFNALYCSDLLKADRVFIVKSEDFGFTFVGANGKQGEWFNRLGSFLWALVFEQNDNIFGDILLIRNEDFSES